MTVNGIESLQCIFLPLGVVIKPSKFSVMLFFVSLLVTSCKIVVSLNATAKFSF